MEWLFLLLFDCFTHFHSIYPSTILLYGTRIDEVSSDAEVGDKVVYKE